MMTNCFVCKKDVVGPNYYLHLQLEHSRPRVSHLIKVEANAIAEGKRQEQSRIIKLLETTRLDGTWCNPDQYCNHSVTCHEVFDWLGVSIALIKGETNGL